jgi:hypothetical protein
MHARACTPRSQSISPRAHHGQPSQLLVEVPADHLHLFEPGLFLVFLGELAQLAVLALGLLLLLPLLVLILLREEQMWFDARFDGRRAGAC